MRCGVGSSPSLNWRRCWERFAASARLRGMLWQACEPDDKTVQRLVMRIEAQVDREAVWAHRYARWRIPSAAAACIMVGFLFGWVGHGTPPVVGSDPGPSMAVSTNSNPTNQLVQKLIPNLPSNVPPGNLTNVAVSNPVDVPLVDEYGHVVATQHFKIG